MNRDADAIRAGGVAASRLLRTHRRWQCEAEDVRQDGILGALEALRSNPGAPFPYLVAGGTNRILSQRLGRQLNGARGEDAYAVPAQHDAMYDPWPQVDAVLSLVALTGDLTPRERRAITEEGGGRSDPAHYQAHKRAVWKMREKACA
jgi:DNA-directed RNA polymerase specialized sigma24 family protein